jgi:hypothetical protein
MVDVVEFRSPVLDQRFSTPLRLAKILFTIKPRRFPTQALPTNEVPSADEPVKDASRRFRGSAKPLSLKSLRCVRLLPKAE